MGVLALVLAAVAAMPVPSASVAVSNDVAGARPVALTLRLTYEMQCGYPGPGPVTIRLPAAERLPARLDRASVLVGGKPARGVTLSGRTVTIELAPPPPVMCMVIAPGTLTIRVTKAAGLGNPSRAGTYMVTASRGKLSFAAALRIRPA